jgi:hypothetical protein
MPSWVANTSLVSQEIRLILLKKNVHNRFHNSKLLFHIHGATNEKRIEIRDHSQ